MGVNQDYSNPLYDIDDDETVAEYCLQDRFRGRVRKKLSEEIRILELEEEGEDLED